MSRTTAKDVAKDNVAVDLCAVIAAASPADARVLTVGGDGRDNPMLPAGPLSPIHRTLDLGLRNWVVQQTQLHLGHVEQLYTFGDTGRQSTTTRARRALSIGYLALVREAQSPAATGAAWQSWYAFFPWEDWRNGKPRSLAVIRRRVKDWIAAAPDESEKRKRRLRATHAFATDDNTWNDERVLERYELLYETGFVPEAHTDGAVAANPPADRAASGIAMYADHRRILATGIARLRGKIKYRPLVFELMPPAFTLLNLQQTVEALAGVRLHKPNFRRLVEQQGLVEPTDAMDSAAGGRPARVWRFRAEVMKGPEDPGFRLSRPARPS